MLNLAQPNVTYQEISRDNLRNFERFKDS